MLSAFKRAVDYLWNGEDIQSDSEEDDECDVNVGSNLKTLSGKISHVYSGHGLINDEIYFRFEDVLGGVRPSVGDEVSVVSKRQQSESGWKAVQVTPLLDWLKGCPEYNQNSPSPLTPASHWDGSSVDPEPTETETKYPQAEAIIGKVSGFTKETGFINETVPFKQDGCLNGFLPCTGDWVKANVTTTCPDGSDMAQVASEIAPLRTFQFEGEITAVMNDHGFIEANTTTSIFFYTGAFVGPDFPQKNDSVRGTAVESAQGQCVWRAIEVCPVFNPFPCERVMNPSSGDPVDTRYLQDLCSNKHGVHVTGDVKFGTVAPGEVKVQTVWVKNHGAHPQALLGCEVWGQSSLFSVKSIKLVFEHPVKTGANDKRRNINISVNEKAVLYPAMGLYLNVACEPRYIGSEFQLLVLQFEGFCIGRRLSVTVTDPHQVHIEPVRDSASGDHGNRRSKAWNKARGERGSGWVVPGQRPSNRFRQTLPHRLPQFSVTEELESCVYNREDVTHICPRLAQDLDSHIYASKFHTLLHLEEIQMNIDIREFDLERVSLRPVGQFLALSVPGLAEGRPSVLIGDKVTVSEPGQGEGLCYEGYVHEVLSEDLLLKFHESFHQRYNREDYDVVFSFNRSTLRRCHQACDLALQLGEEVLFPKNVRPKLPQWVPCSIKQKSKKNHEILSENSVNYGKSEEGRMTFLNAQLNKRQREAVVRIVLGQARPTPYILFGPPGTGKTVTVVEAVLQIFLHCTHSRVLVCTPSNSAADLIAERLHQSGKVTTSDLVRINALQRSEESIPECIRRYCYTEESLGLVSRYRIIVCTCSSAGLLLSLGLRVGHITHVFVDEAGQATEPECLIPVSLIAGADGQIVLAGDPHQLGPVLCSKLAKLYGLELSYLERLTQLPLYQRDVDKYSQQGGYNPLLVTKLTDNYRSHESLLSLPSRLFYDDELSVKADLSVTHSMTGWPHLPTVGFPLIFHGVRGEDMREGNSPSWFNPMETVQVIRYLQMLFTDDGRRVTADQVGVITAYRKQVEKIRLLMDRLGVPAVKVGSVEEFQGQERKVIIISTVRSTETLVGFDERHHLGFLSNRKRFNVAITRAQALLIVIGNPFVLAEDVYWRSLIRFASDSGGYTGCDLPDLESCQNGVANIS